MKRTLHLTSPHTRGDDVKYARRLLKRNTFNEFYTGFLTHAFGGWGEDEAAATRRAKFELGYPAELIDGAFTTQLERYLRRDDPLPVAYQTRRRRRLRNVGGAALAEAERWVGTKEHPAGSNIALPFTEWYGWDGWGAPWCAVFVSYCLGQAGFEYVSPRNARWAYVPYLLRDARAQRYGLREVSWDDALPGDLVCFDWDYDDVPDHVGFLHHKTGERTFHTVEGNTAVGNDSNGGQVMVRDRDLRNVSAFVHAS